MPVVASTPGATALTGRHAAELLRQVADEVARQEQPAQAQRPEGIRRDGFVSEPGHEHALARLQAQQPPQLRQSQRLGLPGRTSRASGGAQRDIAPGQGLPSAASPRRVENGARPSRQSRPAFAAHGANAPPASSFSRQLFSQSAFGLHGKVRPDPHFSDILSL